MNIINIIEKIEYHLSQPRLSFFKTVYFNFRVLPFRQAMKLPIFIYGNVSFYWLKGTVCFENCNIRKGMVKLGRNSEFFNGVDNSAFILLGNNAKLIFEGPCSIGNNYSIRVADGAVLRFGEYTFMGSAIKFICINSISIGKYSRIAYESQLVDSNFHYTYSVADRKISTKESPIIIGAFNWIGNKSSISKGVVTKDYTIVCSNSLLNKNYSKIDGDNQTLGGQPAKLLTTGVKRLFSVNIESYMNSYFKEKPEESSVVYDDEIIDDYTSLNNWFNK